MYPIAIFDGAVVDLHELRFSDFASGFFFGCGLFETLLLDDGAPQFLDRHLSRLQNSLRALSAVQAPRDASLLEAGRLMVGLDEALARLRVEGLGVAPTVMKITVSDGHVLVTFRAPSLAGAPSLREGVNLDGLERSYRSGDRFANHKTTSYLKQYSNLRNNILFANELDELCESATANLFVAFEDHIATPPTDAPCLPGIIREVLLKVGRVGRRPVIEKPIHPQRLAFASGCFLTNSVVIASPVAVLLGRQLSESASLGVEVRELVFGLSRSERAGGTGA